MPKPFHSLAGMLLLDDGNLRGSCFDRTVVLVCSHDASGAMGLVLNRPGPTPLDAAFDRKLPSALRQRTLFSGGPVQPAALSFLHTGENDPASGSGMKGLILGHDLDALIALGKQAETGLPLRVFAGYAGWSAGQLDDELKRDAWLTHPASLDLIFDVAPETLWHHILRLRNGWRDRLLAIAPDDHSLN